MRRCLLVLCLPPPASYAGWAGARRAPEATAVLEPGRAQLKIFLRDCKSDPDDDLPRLVLADWLQDHGEARGELVHVQVRRSRLPEGDPDHAHLRPREMRLLAQHSLRWLGPLADRASE